MLTGGAMVCISCGSEKQQHFSGELSVASVAIEKLKQAPVYVVKKILVCLDCGYTELIVPTTELAQLRKGI
jgi:predicted nucleic-acid-binding Zn-ribbon protein